MVDADDYVYATDDQVAAGIESDEVGEVSDWLDAEEAEAYAAAQAAQEEEQEPDSEEEPEGELEEGEEELEETKIELNNLGVKLYEYINEQKNSLDCQI